MRALVSLMFLVSLGGCAKSSEPFHDTSEKGEQTEMLIPSLGISIDVPTGTDVVFAGAGATFYTQPGGRNPRAFSIEEWPPVAMHHEPATGEGARKLASGVSVKYQLRVSSGGSSGDESVLSGALTVGTETFAVHCHDQVEPPAAASPEWCLDLLATVRVAK